VPGPSKVLAWRAASGDVRREIRPIVPPPRGAEAIVPATGGEIAGARALVGKRELELAEGGREASSCHDSTLHLVVC
jgi:hypothetical protein